MKPYNVVALITQVVYYWYGSHPPVDSDPCVST